MSTSQAVDEYLAALPPQQRAALESLRAEILAVAPEATETISYQMPTFRWGGRALVSMAAFKSHCSLFPMSKAVVADAGEELASFRTGKGTLQFTPERPIPARLVAKIVRGRMAEITAAAAR